MYKLTTSFLKIINKIPASIIRESFKKNIHYALEDYKQYQESTRKEDLINFFTKASKLTEISIEKKDQEQMADNIAHTLVQVKKKMDLYGYKKEEMQHAQTMIHETLIEYVQQEKNKVIARSAQNKNEQELLEQIVDKYILGRETKKRTEKSIATILPEQAEEITTYSNKLAQFLVTTKKVLQGFSYNKKRVQETTAIEITVPHIHINKLIGEIYSETNLNEFTTKGIPRFYAIIEELNNLMQEKERINESLHITQKPSGTIEEDTILSQGTVVHIPTQDIKKTEHNYFKIKGDTNGKYRTRK